MRYMFHLVWLVYIILALAFSGCASFHDTMWDIEPIPRPKPAEKPVKLLTPEEHHELEKEFPNAFQPALPAIDPDGKVA